MHEILGARLGRGREQFDRLTSEMYGRHSKNTQPFTCDKVIINPQKKRNPQEGSIPKQYYVETKLKHHVGMTPASSVVGVSGMVKISPPTILKHHRDNP